MNAIIPINGRRLLAFVALGIACTGAAGTWAAPAEPAREQMQDQNREQVYGWELMTPEERQAFQARMRNATSAEERQRIRAAHHAQMQVRARERGVDLHDMEPGRGMGGGPGQGPGAGRGAGQGGAGKRQGDGPDH